MEGLTLTVESVERSLEFCNGKLGLDAAKKGFRTVEFAQGVTARRAEHPEA